MIKFWKPTQGFVARTINIGLDEEHEQRKELLIVIYRKSTYIDDSASLYEYIVDRS